MFIKIIMLPNNPWFELESGVRPDRGTGEGRELKPLREIRY